MKNLHKQEHFLVVILMKKPIIPNQHYSSFLQYNLS